MYNLFEMTLMGIFATLIMDILAILLGKVGVIKQQIEPFAIGRWVLYMLKGKFVHEDINTSPAIKGEGPMTTIAHYLIGIALIGIYLLIESNYPALRNQPLFAIVYGIATTILPWFWLYPSLGLGVIASNAPSRKRYVIASLVNHFDFGLGMAIWILAFR